MQISIYRSAGLGDIIVCKIRDTDVRIIGYFLESDDGDKRMQRGAIGCQ